MPPRATALILACALSAVAHEVQALGFGRLNSTAVLGQPLNLPVPLRLDAGEQLELECVQAAVTAGESQWGRDQVRVRLEPGSSPSEWVARITSTLAVEEPVVEITLTVGCERRFSRRFIALADPPGMQPARQESPAPATAAVPFAAAEPSAVVEPPPRSSRSQPARAADGQATAPATQRNGRTTPSARKPAGSSPAVASAAPRPAARADNGARLMLEVGGPRLKLDIEDPVFMPSAPADSAASATESDAASAVPETQRLQLLEKTLAELQRDSQSAREATGALRARLAEAETGNRALPWVLGLLVLAVLVAVWLAWRLRRLHEQAAGLPHWWAPEQSGGELVAGESFVEALEPTAPHRAPPQAPQQEFTLDDLADEATDRIGEATSPLPAALALEREVAQRLPTRDAAPLPPEAPIERTMVMPPASFTVERAPAEPQPAREVSVEELLDLEQQADFFIALGQEDAAVDLLMSHLRSTGGLSPLPYTKLLEIYRRQGDREAYERIRARFNRRFNAYAPDWDAGPLSGRALEDYAAVVQQLQALWSQPLDAMALLEAMLFRKDSAHELFDLPAYKDVLLLYALARDLWQLQGGTRATGVDVLLPLEDNLAAEADAHQEAGDTTSDLPHFQLTAFALPPQPDPQRNPAGEEDEADGPRR